MGKTERFCSSDVVVVSSDGPVRTNLAAAQIRRTIVKHPLPPKKKRQKKTPPSSPLNPCPPSLLENNATTEELFEIISALKDEIHTLKNEAKVTATIFEKKVKEEVEKRMQTFDMREEIRFYCSFENQLDALCWTSIMSLNMLWQNVTLTLTLSPIQIASLKKAKLSVEGLFYSFLVWMRKGLSIRELFGDHERVFSRRFHTFVKTLLPWAKQLVCFPSSLTE